MANKFLIALNLGASEQRDAITTYIQAKSWKVWHWYHDLWLISGVPEDVTSWSLYQELNKIAALKGRSILVMKVDGKPSYFGAASPDSWPWMVENWGEVSSASPAPTQPASP